jgi:predicted GNAT family acetyltransferase
MVRSLKIRYKEHIQSIKYNKEDSAFAQHILNTGHQYGPIEQIMALIEKARKGKLMNTKENFHIYLYNQANALIHEQKQNTGDRHNSLYDLVTKHTTH